MRRLAYAIPAARLEALLANLAERFGAVVGRSLSREEHYVDSFDDRLFRENLMLATINPRSRRPALELTKGGRDGALVARVPLGARAARQPLAFGAELPEVVRAEVAPILDHRRLLPRLALRHETTALRLGPVRGGLRVELARDQLLGFEGSAPDLPARLTFPAAGERAEALQAHLEEGGFATALDHRAIFAARRLGRAFGAYSGKLAIELSPVESAAAAARKIQLALLEVMERNEDGVIRDLDAEFLHDFRVAIRRARAALGQLRGVFPADATEIHKEELRWLGQATGPQRDLDVHLELLPRAALALGGDDPATAVAVTLAPLEGLLRERQRDAHAALAEVLGSERYRRWKDSWRRFLETPSASEGSAPAAEQEILVVVAGRLRKIFRRLRKRGKKADADTPAAEMHQLRIDGKKLRYLLELCRSLFPEDALEPVLRRLKVLQEHLGELNDLEVQKGALLGFAAELATRGCPYQTLLALGRLVEQADHRQRQLRDHSAEAFEALRADAVRDFFRELGDAADRG